MSRLLRLLRGGRSLPSCNRPISQLKHREQLRLDQSGNPVEICEICEAASLQFLAQMFLFIGHWSDVHCGCSISRHNGTNPLASRYRECRDQRRMCSELSNEDVAPSLKCRWPQKQESRSARPYRLKNVRVCVSLLSPTDILRSGKNSGYMPRPFTRYVLHKGDITCVPTTITVSSNIL